MIEVENLTKFFGEIPAIRDVSFEVQKGEIVGFLGPNGAGKSTTMRILACYFPPSSGSARVAGHDVFNDSLNVRRKIGYFPERTPLYLDMSVISYLNFVSEIRGIGKSDRKHKVDKVMTDCDIKKVSSWLIKNLSKGFRQRVCLAQALIHDPEVLILDEPTIGLDPKQLAGVRKLIQNLSNERTVLLSTHILHEVSMVCQRVIIIDQGRVITVDTPENLMSKVQKYSQMFVKIEGPTDQVIKKLKNITGVLQVEETGVDSHNLFTCQIESKKNEIVAREISSIVYNNGWGLLEMTPKVMSLEEIFLKIVADGKNGSVPFS